MWGTSGADPEGSQPAPVFVEFRKNNEIQFCDIHFPARSSRVIFHCFRAIIWLPQVLMGPRGRVCAVLRYTRDI